VGLLRAWECFWGALGACGCKFVKCPKSYYTEQFEKYGYIRDKYGTTYNTPTPYDPSLVVTVLSFCGNCAQLVVTISSGCAVFTRNDEPN